MTRTSSSRNTAEARGDAMVDAYLASIPPDARATLEKMRRQIRSVACEADEGFSYGIPAFKLAGRPLVGFAAFKRHCAFYPMSPAVLRAHAADLEGYETAKGTIRFPVDKPLPGALVKKLVKARIAEMQQRKR